MRSIFSRRRPWVTQSIIAINVAIFLIQAFLPKQDDHLLVAIFGLSERGLLAGFLWQPFTHMFLHANLFHLFVNMLGIWFAGQAVELWLGPRRYLLIYFVGGILGGLLQVISFPGDNLIGASGGVCAVLLAFTTLEPEMPITALIFFIIPVRLRAKFLGWGVIGISLVLPLVGLDPQVGHFAHLGGALTGMFYILWLRHTGHYHPRIAPPPIFTPPQTSEFPSTRSIDIDRLLDKVNTQGLHSLTPQERHLLETWTQKRG